MAGMDVMESPSGMSGQNAQLDTTPSASAPDYRPAVPKPKVTVFPVLLPWNFIFALIPFTPDTLGPTTPFHSHRAPVDAIPPWTLWHERWFHTFHPWTWVFLMHDDHADQLYLREVDSLWKSRKTKLLSTGLSEAEAQNDEYYIALSRDCSPVIARCVNRYVRIYGLFHLREIYLARQGQRYPGLSDAELIALVPLGETDQLPTVGDGSVWPFTFPAPPRCTCKSAPPNPCSCVPAPPSPRHFVYPSAKPLPPTSSHTRSLSDTLINTFFSLPQSSPPTKPSTKPNLQRFAVPHRNDPAAYRALAQRIASRQRGKQSGDDGAEKVYILGTTIEVSSTAVKLAAHGATATAMTHRPRVQAC